MPPDPYHGQKGRLKMYPWFKLLHLFFIISWFAGLFYLPRIYVNLAQVDPKGSTAEYQRLVGMSQRLYRFMLPLATLAAMLVGAVAGHYSTEFVGMETLITLSLAVAGLALLLPSRQRVLAWLMPALALVHGWAHGVEAAPDAFWQFTAGFVMASAALLAVGFGAGALLRRHQRVRQLAGGGLVAAAAVLFAG